MNNDAFTFGILCFVSRNSFMVPNLELLRTLGILLIVIGGLIKFWAAILLKDGYYWIDFFIPNSKMSRCLKGPYRLLNNPMYTIGYLPAYGIAICLYSWPGLLAACIDQFLILAFNYKIEVPHYREVFKNNFALTSGVHDLGG
jgi:protein-S-isoprenylcysteine O-methyltransferase Ste14